MQREVHASGRIYLARVPGGKLVTVIIEDIHLRILDGDEEIAVRLRSDLTRSPGST